MFTTKFAAIEIPVVMFLALSSSLAYIARVPVYLDGTKPRQLVRYKELPYKDVFQGYPCVYPGALIEDPQSEWMCSLRCECIESGDIACKKKCAHTQAQLAGKKKCLVSKNNTAGACCPKIECDEKLQKPQQKLVSIEPDGAPPGVELFCEHGKPLPLAFCSTFSQRGDRYDWGRTPSQARCEPGSISPCVEYYVDYDNNPAVNNSVRSYLYTSSLRSTTEQMREEVRDTGRKQVVKPADKKSHQTIASSSSPTNKKREAAAKLKTF